MSIFRFWVFERAGEHGLREKGWKCWKIRYVMSDSYLQLAGLDVLEHGYVDSSTLLRPIVM
jgi:hypothetical protein